MKDLLLSELNAVYDIMLAKRGEYTNNNEAWEAVDFCMGVLRDTLQYHRKERNRMLAEQVQAKMEQKPLLYVVFANFDYYPSGGMTDAVCVTADWRAACYAYRAASKTNNDAKTVSMWQLEEGTWEEIEEERVP